MTRKLLLLLSVVLCGFVQRFECSRVKFDSPYHEPMYRHDHGEAVCKREHFYPREALPPADHMLPQPAVIRNEPMYSNEPIMVPPQQAVEDYIPNEQMMPAESFIRREAFLRREPIHRRESFIRSEPIMRTGRIYQNAPVLREGGLFRPEPSPYSFMMSQCSCQEPQSPVQPQETFFQIPQPIQQQPIMTHRLIFPKPMLKPQGYQPIVTFPRIQRYVRKGFKPITENLQFSTTQVQSAPVQELPSFSNDAVTFSGNFQSQGQQQESTSESVQNNPVTMRNIPQMSNPLTLAQMSSIC